jgi:AcrR family transcriptional regulator
MVKKPSSVSQRRRPARSARGVRLREEFRSYARAVILEAGEDVLASQGLHAAKMEEVAQRARVAVGTIYNLIGDRDALVVEIMRLRHEQIVALLTSTLERVLGQAFRAQAEACLAALLGYFREHRRFYRMALESERGPACAHKRLSEDTLGKIRAQFRELVARGVEAGSLRREALELSACLLMGMMREVIMLDVETQHPSAPEERAAEVLSIFMDGAGVK